MNCIFHFCGRTRCLIFQWRTSIVRLSCLKASRNPYFDVLYCIKIISHFQLFPVLLVGFLTGRVGLARWWKHPPFHQCGLDSIPCSTPCVDWVRWFLTLLWDIFLLVLPFSPLTRQKYGNMIGQIHRDLNKVIFYLFDFTHTERTQIPSMFISFAFNMKVNLSLLDNNFIRASVEKTETYSTARW